MIRQVARVRRIIGQEGELHPRFVQLLRRGERAVIGIVFISRETEDGTEQYGDVLLLEQLGDLRRFKPAAHDDLDLLLVGELDGGFDVPIVIGGHDQR
ncbi:hypothetical protein HRbin10_01911 [bacterium HR10]|nr:hypothetical protein HRbin10_01911 [bacterium HR10]